MPHRSRLLSTIGSIYVLIPLIVVAATALAYYSYRSADELARRGERSVIETTDELAAVQIDRVEKLVLDSEDALFNSIDLEDLREFPQTWKNIMQGAPVVETAIVLNADREIIPDGYHSKRQNAADVKAFRELFEQKIKSSLALQSLQVDERRHIHREFDGRYELLSYTRRVANGQTYYIVLEDDLATIVSEVFPDIFSGVENRRLYQITDEAGNVVFGHMTMPLRFASEPKVFANTLSAWTLRMAPRDTAALIAKQSERRSVFGGLLIALSCATIFVGLGILTFAVRAERQANRLKSDFIANVSHELKTPLSLIRMFGELLATGRTKGPESAKEYAEIITRESERLSRLIDNVLDFARIERGKAAYTFQVGDLGEVLSRGLDVYRYRLDRENMKLVVDVAPELPPVRIDENAMTLVLLNLVDNAVKYANEGKLLRVSVKQRGDRVLLQVQDQGPGIGEDERERIFDRFYRARAARNRPVRGSGIGLSLVKHIAEAHGGGVEVESELGKGSTFTVWLPVADPATLSDDAAAAEGMA